MGGTRRRDIRHNSSLSGWPSPEIAKIKSPNRQTFGCGSSHCRLDIVQSSENKSGEKKKKKKAFFRPSHLVILSMIRRHRHVVSKESWKRTKRQSQKQNPKGCRRA